MRICLECGQLTGKGEYCSSRCAMRFFKRMKRAMKKTRTLKNCKVRQKRLEKLAKKNRFLRGQS